ncbi:MAG TPA: DsrE family protein [Gemmatimonadaceae bacterium]|nr:DsrE family protein [Gemmatimonadaceae bacterium]
MRRALLLAILAVSAAPPVARAQPGAAVIASKAASPIAREVSFPAPKDVVFRIAYGVNTGPEKADALVEGFKSAANFIYVADSNGVPRSNLKLAIVVWGSATHSLLKNDAYRAAKGVDNASESLLGALNDAGVQIIVCGEALINRKIDRAQLLPFVKVAPTASIALATLHAQGYAIFR